MTVHMCGVLHRVIAGAAVALSTSTPPALSMITAIATATPRMGAVNTTATGVSWIT